MSHHAHGTQHAHHSATKHPTAYVRTVQEKRPPVGWLDVPADEFMRLLSLHNAGAINLLTMPETAADAVELSADEPEEDTVQPGEPRRTLWRP